MDYSDQEHEQDQEQEVAFACSASQLLSKALALALSRGRPERELLRTLCSERLSQLQSPLGRGNFEGHRLLTVGAE